MTILNRCLIILIITIIPNLGFGRYYDIKISRWISADPPLARGTYLPVLSDLDTDHDYYWQYNNDKTAKLPGMGGVYSPINLDAYQYGGQNPTKYIDPDGNDIILLNKSYGAGGFGHNAVLVGNDKTGWNYFSKDGTGGKRNRYVPFRLLADFIKMNQNPKNEENHYDRAYRVKTTTAADKKMIDKGKEIKDRAYSISEKISENGNVSQNCADLSSEVGEAGGVDISKPQITLPVVGKFTYPNKQYSDFIKNNSGSTVRVKKIEMPSFDDAD